MSMYLSTCKISARNGNCLSPVAIIGPVLIAILLFVAAPLASAQDVADPVVPISFEGYPGAPEVNAIPRKDQLSFYPCDQCHASMEPNPKIRPLEIFHFFELEHGQGKIWCLTCHNFENRNYLTTLLDEPVDFDESHIVCGSCHSNRHKDWNFGVHGKRTENWQGERNQYNCTHCHDPHSPAIEPRAPKPAPNVRLGLEKAHGEEHEAMPVWKRREGEQE